MTQIYFTTLSLGKNYTQDYACNLINDILTKTNHIIAITTDCPNIINDIYPNNSRILIDIINKKDLKIRLPIGHENSTASDFNFNLRHLCIKQLLSIPNNFYTIWTDCDNSLEWWDENIVQSFFNEINSLGYDFLAPRTSDKFIDFLNEVKSSNNLKHGNFWHKLFNYDLITNPRPEWDNAPLPAEYLIVLLNSQKLLSFYNQFKWFHDYLINKPYTEGTWAEGFEIGVSSLVAGYIPYDIGWNHEILSKAIKANGHKNKIWHPTESD
jgi:hypothetical protein